MSFKIESSMYSGTTFRNASGNVMGGHQKIDRVARRMLRELLPAAFFPPIRLILHFEGKNGPDGVKRKSPAQDEPWHYYDPHGQNNDEFLAILSSHYKNLVKQLEKENEEGAAFEAAWLAHAIVDGLTPAHHYPYEEELTKLRGAGLETRDSIKEKLVIGGDSTVEALANNWKMWGAKGLMTTHALFELGVAVIISPMRLRRGMPTTTELDAFGSEGLIAVFERTAKEIDALEMYQRYYRFGWTKKLAREVRRELAPRIVKMVTLAWYQAAREVSGHR